VHRARGQRRVPRVAAVQLDERLEGGERADPAREQDGLRPLAAHGRPRGEPTGPEGNERGQPAAADDDEVHARVVDAAEGRSGRLHDLAPGKVAAGRKPPRAEPDGLPERVGGAELDEPMRELHVGELDGRVHRLPGQPPESVTCQLVEPAVAARSHLARPGHAHDAVGRRQAVERMPERQILRDDAASRDAGQERRRHGHARADEQRPARTAAHAPPGEGKRRRPAADQGHDSPRYVLRTCSFERSASASSASATLPVSST
jgi:hypothetical protein